MRLIKLKITKEKNGETIREVVFNKEGVSLIVDADSMMGKSGNNIGKSTFAKLIDICLGSKTAKDLYYDSETKEESKLKDFLIENEVCAELVIEANNHRVHTLRRELWDSGKCELDGIGIKSVRTYQAELKTIIFPDAPESITFRSIMPFFIRVGKNTEELFRYNGVFDKAEKLRIQYDYLFNAQSSINAGEIALDQTRREDDNKKILEKYHFKNVSELDGLIQKTQETLDALLSSAKSPKVVKDFEDDIVNAKLIKDMEVLEQNKYEKELQISVFKTKIENERKSMNEIDIDALDSLYKDGVHFVPEFSRSYEDFLKFHEGMASKRIDRYTARIEELTNSLAEISANLSQMRSSFSSKFIDYKYKVNENGNADIESYLSTKSQLRVLESEKDKYVNNQAEIEKDRHELKSIEENDLATMKIKNFINGRFKEFSQNAIGREISLTFEKKGLPLRCSAGKLSAGNKKTLAACFVFSLISSFENANREMPDFLVQDVMENVSLSDFKSLVDISETIRCQYIVPILRDRVNDLNLPESKIILTLSQNDKLFKF